MSSNDERSLGGGGGGGAPSGPAGGDLGGTYPNPTVTSGAHLAAASVPVAALASAPALIGASNNFGAFAQTAAAYVANLTGTAGRYVGQTSGAPTGTTVTYATNDFATDPTNKEIWFCTAGGAPGTWVGLVGGGGGTVAALTQGAITETLETNGGLVQAGAGAATLGALQTDITAQYISGTALRGYVRVTFGTALPGSTLALISFPAAFASVPYIIVEQVQSATAIYGDSVAASAGDVLSPHVQNPSTTGFTLWGNSANGFTSSVYGFIYHVLG